LDSLFANSSRESASVVYEYVHWLVTVRGHTPSGELKALHSLVALAKFLFHKQSKSDPAEGDKVRPSRPHPPPSTPAPSRRRRRPRRRRVARFVACRQAYSDIGVVRELRRLASDAAARAKIAPKVSNERAKWLDWPGTYLPHPANPHPPKAEVGRLTTGMVHAEYLRCVELLQSECAEKDKLHHRRSPSAVAQSFQLYLMYAARDTTHTTRHDTR
jgi:hypothetical protein